MNGERLETMILRVAQLREDALAAIGSAGSTAELDRLRIQYLGKRSPLTEVMQGMRVLSPQERPVLGATANEARQALEEALSERTGTLQILELDERLQAERLDVTLPGTVYSPGSQHVMLQSVRTILEIFKQMGYSIYEGPEVEWDRFNFEMLNIPKHHPARDLQDTFYITDDMLLRTQTSPAQIRVMQSHAPPVRVVVPGFVYRNEAEDASHGDQFYQIEGLCVDTDISMADLKGTLTEVAHRFFGPDRQVRFRPSYFPFTEPSAELDIECIVCLGTGCRPCGGEGWLELGGSGMVHPNVLRAGGYDPEQVSGFAFGIGGDRYTMMKYGITDLRLFREDDLRFLRQFSA